MKKYIPLLLCILLLASCTGASEKRSRVLKVYNWADYIDEEVLAEFPVWYKEQTGEDIRIIYQVFDINEIMLTKIERGQEDFSSSLSTAILGRLRTISPTFPRIFRKSWRRSASPVATPMITLFPTCGVPPEYSITRSSRPLKKSAPGDAFGMLSTVVRF